MARYNEILVGRYNRFIQKLLSMKGDASLFQFSTEMGGYLQFFSGVENRYLEGWDRFSFANSIAAGGAGNRGAQRIRNPAGSNVIAVFEKVLFWATAQDFPLIQIRAQPADLTLGAISNDRLDARGRPQSSLIISSTGNFGAVTGNQQWQGAVVANTSIDAILFEEQELPLLPGDSADFISGALNQQLNITMMWRERFLEESERT